MNRIKIVTSIFYVTLLLSMAILLKVCYNLNQLLEQITADATFWQEYSMLQKNAGMYSIIAFIVLLCLGLLLFYLSKKSTSIVLANIVYIVVVLYVFITANKSFYENQNLEYAQQSEYWLTVFIGIFYIIGAILVSAIGYITVRNFTKRLQHTIDKEQRKY